MSDAWEQIEAEARESFGKRPFPLRAYSEFMPSPYVGIKPYLPGRASSACTFAVSRADTLDIDEYEQAHDLEPGLDRIAEHLVLELGKLLTGKPGGLPHALLENNRAWPEELASAAASGRLIHDPQLVICPIALSRTQDDKGNDRWTLFGASHERPGPVFWHGLDEAGIDRLLTWAGLQGPWRILAPEAELPRALHGRLLADTPLPEVKALVTFEPFGTLPAAVRAAYLAGRLVLVPTPASLLFFEHPGYRALERELPHAIQIPLLHLFPRVEGSCAIRIPQSGWIDEFDPRTGLGPHRHGRVPRLTRSHRWQRIERDAGLPGDGTFTDKLSVALFSTDPEELGLYGKPLARNSQIWTADYRLLLDGPRADRAAIRHAAGVCDGGGRFGYRMYYPPMRAGLRELFWHLPLVARPGARRYADGPHGYVTAESGTAAPFRLDPLLLTRPLHRSAARLFERDRESGRHTTSQNLRKLLDMPELIRAPLTAGLARTLIHVARDLSLESWLAGVEQHCSDREAVTELIASLGASVVPDLDPGPPLVLDHLGSRAFEEEVWRNIVTLAHGEFRQKNGADGIRCNRGRHGGPAAAKAGVRAHDRRDLDALGDYLHSRYRAAIERHGMTGQAEVVDHVFRWETDFDFPWMEGWERNRDAPHERNVVLVIPGRDRQQAVVMADHYDTAYMEDVYEPASGGDELRAPACGADDNHSATSALLLAAEQLLPLSRAGKLVRDVWLVHLTGEEFPADCLGARMLAQALVERRLRFATEE